VNEAATSCSFGDDTSGTFTAQGGYAYFDGDYWGAAYVGSGQVQWASYAYVYGAGGYTYLYAGAGTYTGSPGDGGDGDDPEPGDGYLVGDFSADIVELACGLDWDMDGPTTPCSGCDIAFDVDLHPAGGTCSFDGSSTSGVLEFDAGYAYFRGDYLGAAYVGSGLVQWVSYAYIYGSGGYTYLYSGSGEYD